VLRWLLRLLRLALAAKEDAPAATEEIVMSVASFFAAWRFWNVKRSV
jgi:hypothetical protein